MVGRSRCAVDEETHNRRHSGFSLIFAKLFAGFLPEKALQAFVRRKFLLQCHNSKRLLFHTR